MRRYTLMFGITLACIAGPGSSEPGSGGGSVDAADRAAQKAAEDLAKVQDRAARDASRYTEERAKIMEDAAKDPAKAEKDLAKLDADAAKWDADRAAETIKIETELAEEEAEIRQETAEDAERSGERSESVQGLGAAEGPQRDERGFPVRRGEISALDLSANAIQRAQGRGFRVIERINLDELGRSLVRLAVPNGVGLSQAEEFVRSLDQGAVVDLTHYYGMEPAGERAEPAGKDLRLSKRAGRLEIGMIDSTVGPHAFLKGTSVRRREFGQGVSAGGDHGTAVASILASEGAKRILAAGVFRAGADGAPFTSAEAIAKALEWLASERTPVINMSLAGPRNAILDVLILRALKRGILVVAAAGNGGPAAAPAYPAALPKVVAVTAVDGNRRIYRYANQGKYITVAARGVREPAAAGRDAFGYYSGTSFATPHVAAWIARCLEGSRRQAVDANRCRARMTASAIDLGEPGYDTIFGYGLVAGS